MGYTSKAIQGFSWHSFFKFTTTGLTILKIIFVYRLLLPEDIGLFSLTTIALGLTQAATETGINITLIHSQRSLKYYLDTAWVIAIIRGLIIAIVMGLVGLCMSSFYKEPQLLVLVTLASFVPLIKGFINPSIVALQKELSFFWDSVYRISLVAVEVTTALLLILIWKSVFILLVAMIVSAAFEVAISFTFFKNRPRLDYKPTRAKDIFTQMKWLNTSSILNYLHENADNLVIGKMTGKTNLGFYHVAYNAGHKPNYELAKSVHHATLPIFIKIKNDAQRLSQAFWKSRISSFIGFAAVSAPFLIYPKLILLLFGKQWITSVPLVRPLVIAGLIQSLSMLAYTLLIAKKEYKTLNIHLGITTVLMISLIIILTPIWGIEGSAWGVTISRIATLPLILFFMKNNLAPWKFR